MGRIFVVDDYDLARDTLVVMLESEGYEVDSAATAAEAMEKFAKLDVDLAIIDILLPDKSGFEVIHDMRKTRPDLKVIAISGAEARVNVNTLRGAEAMKVDATLEKPLELSELIQTVNGLLKAIA